MGPEGSQKFYALWKKETDNKRLDIGTRKENTFMAFTK
jgi:hypothetical protein